MGSGASKTKYKAEEQKQTESKDAKDIEHAEHTTVRSSARKDSESMHRSGSEASSAGSEVSEHRKGALSSAERRALRRKENKASAIDAVLASCVEEDVETPTKCVASPKNSRRQRKSTDAGDALSALSVAAGETGQVGSSSKKNNTFHDSKDCAWHQKNCTDKDFHLVETIAAAYPFDASKRKTVQKKEEIYGGLADPTRTTWGEIDVMTLGPPRISCDACGAFILTREMEVPFYVCRHCRASGRKLEMCVNCYESGVLATGRREVISKEPRRASAHKPSGGFLSGGPMRGVWEEPREESNRSYVPSQVHAGPSKRALKI